MLLGFTKKSLKSIKLKDLEKLVSQYEVFSFDIFDTLLLRKVWQPVDIFTIVQFRFQSKFNKLKDFKQDRINAEIDARKSVNQIKQDIIYSEIYNELEKYGYSKLELNFLSKTEKEVEFENLIPNLVMLEFVNLLIRQKKKIVFCSDMYLDKEFLIKILKNCGYERYDRFFVSSESHLSKNFGGLFEKYSEFNKSKVIHFGDNYHSDVKMPQKFGIKAFYYPNKHALSYTKNTSIQHLEGLIDNSNLFVSKVKSDLAYFKYFLNSDNYFFEFGKYIAGPLLLGFIKWIDKIITNQNYRKVFFCMRDGYFLKELYEVYSNKRKVSLLYLSRRSINFPIIENLDDGAIRFLLSGTTKLKVKDYFARIGIEEFELTGSYLTKDTEIINKKDFDEMEKVLLHNKEKILNKSTYELVQAKKYFEQAGLKTSKRNLIIDVGWHGSLQYSLNRLLNPLSFAFKIDGVYLGLFPAANWNISKGLNMEAYLTKTDKNDIKFQIIRECVELFEDILLAPVGSTLNYYSKGKIVEPNCEKLDKQYDNTLKMATEIQKGVVSYINEIMKEEKGNNFEYNIDNLSAIFNIANVLLNPDTKDLENIGNMEHSEGFGSSVKYRYFIDKTENVFEGFDNSFWKRGYYAKSNTIQKVIINVYRKFRYKNKFFKE